jgi:ADP-ribose pyrophosphatase YjhB (NUDIX family)
MNKFQPKAGQIDFTNIRWAPVINCVVKYQDKFLMVKRSKDVNYPGTWDGVSGFLDDNKSLEEKVWEEMEEEIGVTKENIISIKVGQIFDKNDEKKKKTYVIHPILVEISTDQIKLCWENEEYRWIDLDETKNFDLLPGYEQVLKNVL